MGSSIKYPVSKQTTITSSLTISLKAKKSYKPPKKIEDTHDLVTPDELVRLYGNAGESVPLSFSDFDRDITDTNTNITDTDTDITDTDTLKPVNGPEPVTTQTPKLDTPTSSMVKNKFVIDKNTVVKSKWVRKE